MNESYYNPYELTICIIGRLLAVIFVVVWSVSLYIDFSIYRWLVAICMMTFIFLLFLIKKRFPNQYLPSAIFIAFLPSVFFSEDRTYSIAQFVRIMLIVLFATYLMLLSKNSRLKILNDSIFVLAGFTSISVLLYPFLSGYISANPGERIRFSGLFYHENIAGFCSGTVVLYSLYYLLSGIKGYMRYFYYSATLITGFLLLLWSDSRSALFSLVIGGMVFIEITLRQKLRIKINIMYFVSLFLVIFSFAPLFYILMFDQSELATSSYGTSLKERIYLWDVAFLDFKKSIFHGAGFGLPLYTGDETWDGELIFYPYAHNLVLTILGWSGLFGAIYIIALFYMLIRASKMPTQNYSDLNCFPKCLVIYVFSWSIFDGALQGMWVTHFIFWLSVSSLLKSSHKFNRL